MIEIEGSFRAIWLKAGSAIIQGESALLCPDGEIIFIWAEEGLIGEMEVPFEAVKCQQVLGGDGFLRQLKDRWNQRVKRPKNYGQKRIWSAVGAEQVLERVSEHFQSDFEALKERRFGKPRSTTLKL